MKTVMFFVERLSWIVSHFPHSKWALQRIDWTVSQFNKHFNFQHNLTRQQKMSVSGLRWKFVQRPFVSQLLRSETIAKRHVARQSRTHIGHIRSSIGFLIVDYVLDLLCGHSGRRWGRRGESREARINDVVRPAVLKWSEKLFQKKNVFVRVSYTTRLYETFNDLPSPLSRYKTVLKWREETLVFFSSIFFLDFISKHIAVWMEYLNN